MGLWQVYRSLSSEQKRAIETKGISLNRPIGETLDFLMPIAAWDRMEDKSRTRFGCSIPLAVIATILFIILTANGVLPRAAGLILIALSVAVIVVSSIIWTLLRRTDISSNLGGFAIPALALLREDVDAAAPVHVELHLAPPVRPDTKKSESAPYKIGPYYHVVDTIYVDEWMRAELPLRDGTRVRWAIRDTVRTRDRRKKNPRGKIKFSTKISRKSRITAEVTMKTKTFSLGNEADVKSGDGRQTVRRRNVIASKSLDPLAPRELLDLLTSVYRRATPATGGK